MLQFGADVRVYVRCGFAVLLCMSMCGADMRCKCAVRLFGAAMWSAVRCGFVAWRCDDAVRLGYARVLQCSGAMRCNLCRVEGDARFTDAMYRTATADAGYQSDSTFLSDAADGY